MGTHQNKHILQEDECVVNWQGQKHGGEKTSSEEICWVHDSPSATFVDLEEQSVEALFCLLE